MTISSRTPEGLPQHCPLCGEFVRVEPSLPAHDAPCPYCGQLLWFQQGTVSALSAIDSHPSRRHLLIDVSHLDNSDRDFLYRILPMCKPDSNHYAILELDASHPELVMLLPLMGLNPMARVGLSSDESIAQFLRFKRYFITLRPRDQYIVESRLRGKSVDDISVGLQELSSLSKNTTPVTQATIRRVLRESKCRLQELMRKD